MTVFGPKKADTVRSKGSMLSPATATITSFHTSPSLSGLLLFFKVFFFTTLREFHQRIT